jgi:hypothetical protein
MFNLYAWATRWGVSPDALADLRAQLHALDYTPDAPPALRTEGDVVDATRLEATEAGGRLWRNNSGALPDSRGRLIRFGLCNDSPAVNERVKSADLIGVRPVLVRPEHVGRTLGVFVARECKPPGWRYSGRGRERAQLRFLEIVATLGGDAAFTAGGRTI